MAIVDAYGDTTGSRSSIVDNALSDLTAFSNEFGLPTPSLTEAFSGAVPTVSSSYWALETALDIEWVHAIAPDAQILLVVTPSSSFIDLFTGVAFASDRSYVVSQSWYGGDFSGETTDDAYYYNPQYTTFFAATGDGGAGVSYPAASPGVTAVGGTSLTIAGGDSYGDPPYPWDGETGWSVSGGLSSVEGPAWYQGSVGGEGQNRSVPDVSALADPDTGVYVYESGWYDAGGTSLATPFWAAMIALAKGNLALPLTEEQLQADLYLFGSFEAIDANYHDITSGNNGSYPADEGYDYVTGIGSPVGNVLVPALVNSVVSPTMLSLNSQTTYPGATVALECQYCDNLHRPNVIDITSLVPSKFPC